MSSNKSKFSISQIVIALVIGFLGSSIVWIFAPYNNHLFRNSYIADTYLPELAVGIILFLVFAVNPLFYLIRKKNFLSPRQLILIFVMMLIASTHIGGLCRILPFSLARASNDASKDKQLAEVYEKMYEDGLPESLTVDKVKTNAVSKDFEASAMFVDKLKKGKTIPWHNWLPPLLTWGVLLLGFWIMSGGMGLIVFPQWKNNERIPFPLLNVYQTLVDKKSSNTILPDIFRNKLFWSAFTIVFVIHTFNGLHLFTKGQFPAFPLSWNLLQTFSDPPWQHMWWYAKYTRIYFVFLGMAFFMPNRIGFSLWFTFVLYQLYRMFGYTYVPGFNAWGAIQDQRNGAAIALAFIILYLGRAHWLSVMKSMFSRAENDNERRDRIGGWMFVSGNIIMFAWLLFVKVNLFWTIGILLIGFIITLVMARVVAETGIPLISLIDFKILYFMKLFPVKLTTAISIFIGGFCDYIFSFSTRTAPVVALTHALGTDKENGPKQQVRLVYLFLAVLIVGLLICGAASLTMAYNHAASLDGLENPVCEWGSSLVDLTHDPLKEYARGSWTGQTYSQTLHLGVGIVLATALQILCLMLPQWPLHPIGLVMAGTWYIGQAWASIMFGWFIKMAIVRYGGAKAYNIAKPFFLGLIISEIASAILWAIVPLVLIWMGYDPADVGRLTIVPR